MDKKIRGVPRCQWCGKSAPEGFKLHRCGVNDPINPKCPAEEPEFTLMARDQFAPGIVRAWITLAHAAGVNPEKIESAEKILGDMLLWQSAKGKKKPD